MTAISNNELRPLIGWQLYNAMKQALEEGRADECVGSGDPARTFGELRLQCIPFVVKKAVANVGGDDSETADTLMAFIEWKWPEYYPGRPSDIFKRDNNNKKTFWA